VLSRFREWLAGGFAAVILIAAIISIWLLRPKPAELLPTRFAIQSSADAVLNLLTDQAPATRDVCISKKQRAKPACDEQ